MRAAMLSIGAILCTTSWAQSADVDKSVWYCPNGIYDWADAGIEGALMARNVSQADGALQMVIRKETVPCVPTKGGKPTTQNYSVGEVYTKKFTYTYGKLEVRTKMTGPGTWPAVWLIDARCQENYWIVLPEPNWATGWEIDVAEYKPGTCNGCVNKIWQNVKSKTGKWQSFIADVADVTKWHVYELEWAANLLVFKIDGRETFRTTKDVPDSPMFLNLGIGGLKGGTCGKLDDNTLPQTMYVDYARVTQNGKVILEDDFGGECKIP